MMAGRLEGKVAIVTGSGRGIGRGIALRFAEEGADVVVPDIDLALAQETARLIGALGRRALSLRVDVSRRADVERMLAGTLAAFQTVDVLVNNAGIIPHAPFLEITDHEWDRCLSTNLTGSFLCTQVVARGMVRAGTHGKIVNIASVESSVARPNMVPYASSKGGVLMLTKATALDLAPHGINVNAIGPGAINAQNVQIEDPARLQALLSRIPLRRPGTPRDVANAALFLASEESDFMTGSIIYVDGGTLIE